jgi:hypothetical protein
MLTRGALGGFQERPCTRCIKRNIGHLCHDEPRETDSKKTKSVLAPSTVAESVADSELDHSIMDQQAAGSMGPPALDASLGSRTVKSVFEAATLAPGNPLQLVQPTAVSSIAASALGATQCRFLAPLLCPVLSGAEAGVRSSQFPRQLVHQPKPLSRHAQLPPQLRGSRGVERGSPL